MSTHQAPGAVNEPTGPTLVGTPPWARVETPQGRAHAESRSRTADRAAHTPADDTTQVSAVLDPSAQRSSIMTRDNVPNGTQPPLDEAPERSDPVRRVGEELFRQTGQSRPRSARGRTLGNTSDYRGGYTGADGRCRTGGVGSAGWTGTAPDGGWA